MNKTAKHSEVPDNLPLTRMKLAYQITENLAINLPYSNLWGLAVNGRLWFRQTIHES